MCNCSPLRKPNRYANEAILQQSIPQGMETRAQVFFYGENGVSCYIRI